MKYDVFISYSRADIAVVEPFVKRIESETGVKCWIDWNDIESGSQFEEKIISAIDKVNVVIFILSENAMSSPYVKMEINYAYNTQKRVVPVVLDGGELRGWFLFKFGAIDFIDIAQPRQVEKLMHNICEWCNKTSQPTPAPTPAPTPDKTYKVGDYYDDGKKRGVVFEVTSDGKHGKIVSLESETVLKWAANKEFGRIFNGDNPSRNRIGATDKYNGANNRRIVEQITDWRDKYPAFAWCNSSIEGWYLPAIEELKTLLLEESVKESVNKTLELRGAKLLDYWRYWSSTEDEDEAFCAWHVRMDRGKAFCAYKGNDGYVRAVAAF